MRLIFAIIFSFLSILALAQSPGNVSSNLQLWLKADAGTSTTTNGSSLSQWDDQSGNSKHALQATVNNQPIYTQIGNNFNPTIDFDGVGSGNGDFLTAPSIFGTSTISDANIFIVCMREGRNTNLIFEETTAEGRYSSHLVYAPNNNVYYDAGSTSGNRRLNAHWGGSDNIPYIWSMLSSTTSTDLGNNQNILRNSTVIVSDNNYSSFTGVNSNFNLGESISTSSHNPYIGKISEVVIYTGALNASERIQIESYLAIKYGIHKEGDYLASDGTTAIWNSTTNAAYHNGVTVIGRDDNSGLHQRQSHGQESNAIITMGLNSVSVDNISNPNNFSSDKQFFVIGYNGNDLSGSGITDYSTPINNRIGRVWKAIETGTPGVIKIKIDASDMEGPTGIATTDLANVRLLVDGDGIFATGAAVITPTAYDNSTNTIEFDYDFPSAGAYYFTLGSTDANAFVSTKAPGGVIEGLQFWVKADNGSSTSTDGANVSQWDDQSGRDNHGIQGTGGNQPLFRSVSTNFNPGIDYDGNDRLNFSSLLTDKLIGHSNVYIVATQQNSSNNYIFNESTTDGRFSSHLPLGSGGTIYWDAGSSSNPQRQSVNWGGSNDIPYLWSLQASVDATPNGDLQNISRNGEVLVSEAEYSAFTGNNSTFELGRTYNGHINEVLIYTDQHNSTQEKQIESYLAIKYGISKEGDYIDSDGNTLWNSISNVAHHNDVIGIGRDDYSVLNQKQSKSPNTLAILTMGLVDIAVDNNSNGNSFGLDKEFFVVGSNGISSDQGSNTDVGTTINSEDIVTRLNRTWKASETGSVGTLKLQFNMSSSIGPSGAGTNDLADVRLLVDADGTFASGATSIAPSFYDNSTDIVQFDYDFNGATGYFFTIGSVDLNAAPLPIELVQFEVTNRDNTHVRIEWKTASETNNDYFTIERSKDGLRWDEVIRIDGAGNSKVLLTYQYFDYSPIQGSSYYRLKQTDFDGLISYSKVSNIFTRGTHNNIRLFPNPTSDEVTVILERPEWDSINVYSSNTGTDVTSLIHVFESNGQLKLDLESIKSGSYILKTKHSKTHLIVIK